MSGVLKRNRKVSEFKFFSVAIAIRTETNKLMANSKVVPKSYRLLNAVPTVETARSLVYNIVRSDAFYPSNSFNAAERRRYLTLGIADCNQLVQDMQCLLDMGVVEGMPSAPDGEPQGPAARFYRLMMLIDEELKLLKGARKKVRILGQQTLDDRIAAATAELERLEAKKAEDMQLATQDEVSAPSVRLSGHAEQLELL